MGVLPPWNTEKLSGAVELGQGLQFSAGGCDAVEVRDGRGLCPPKWTWRLSNVV